MKNQTYDNSRDSFVACTLLNNLLPEINDRKLKREYRERQNKLLAI
jgi:hypothetical protein